MDSNSFTFRGEAAELYWGYRPVASLRTWELSNGTATAQVVSHDAYAVTQQPLTFVVHTTTGQQWKWRVQSLQIAGHTVTCALAEE